MEAQRKYLRAPYKDPKKWFLVLELKKMHKMMFGNVWDSAGKYRKTLSVDGSEPQKIAVHIAKLCLEVHSWLDDVLKYSMLQMAAVIHFRLVEIKPFEKGNRRFARLVSDRFLSSFKCPYPVWPAESSSIYQEALDHARKGNLSLLVEYMHQLGAEDPSLLELLTNSAFSKYIKDKKGILLVKTMLGKKKTVKELVENGNAIIKLAEKKKLTEIAKILSIAKACNESY